ncbi:uncharacterized protein PGTG_13693 [Puccinia graminis f. sp. tritici CRL 75-36-700-3]|uniref:Cutinase n=1 Tax=Puccinia graminis f. sp. tritici (strain CRL 75-36-700-3 / race SCCL) TaxID=418459 RepID=E3KST5_PUCGT|nr:uncharacterized protein PGTG_13693 [Puccinia graminis f. sp. tritici CRL 75-36-700-3]EFP87465.1 hypothetical protein PGTG_13693 [Puccinia graminis f. sp. tritici CRL 75-36-700-3]
MVSISFKSFLLLVINLQESVKSASVNRATLSKRQFDLSSLTGSLGGGSIPGIGGTSGSGSGSGGSGLGGFPSIGSGTGGGLGGLGSGSAGGLGSFPGMGSGGGTGGLGGLSGMASGSGIGGLGGLPGMGSGSSGTASSSNSDGASLNGQSKSQGSSGGCPSYYMIGARGTSEGPGGSIAYNALYQKVLASVPGGAKEELQYSTSADYSVTVTQGAQTEVKMITGEISKCPKTVFVLLGYSKGAMVQTQTLNNKEIPQDKIAAVALFGNPYFRAGAPQNKCGASSGMGIAAMAGAKMPDQLTDRVYDCCVPGDEICQTAGSIMGHLSYAGQHENDATEFVIQKLKAKLSGATGAQKGSP